MKNKTPTVTDVSIESINVGKRRKPDPDKVKYYGDSIEKHGLLQPIGVTPDKRLIHGGHRLEACRSLGWETIPAIVHDIEDLETELIEIDENLIRSHLTPLELGEALARRKEIYEELYPTTKRGGDRKSENAKSNGNNFDLISFAADAGKMMGKSDETVRSYVKVFERISRDVRMSIEGTSVGGKITELTKLSSLPEADQRAVVKEIGGGAKTVKAAIKAIEGELSPEMQRILEPKADKDSQKAPAGDEEAVQSDDTAAEVPQVEQSNEDRPDELIASVDVSAAPVESSGTTIEDDVEPSTESLGDSDQGHGVEQSVAAARETYSNLLQRVPEEVSALFEHFDDVIGTAMDPSKAADVHQRLIKFFETARHSEVKAAKQLAKSDTSSSD